MNASTENLKVGDKVRATGSYRVYRIVAIGSVFGIPAADLVPVRKDGTDAVNRRKNLKNLPVSVLEKVN